MIYDKWHKPPEDAKLVDYESFEELAGKYLRLTEENRCLKRKVERYEKALQEILKLDDRHKWNLYGLAYSIAEKALMDMRNT